MHVQYLVVVVVVVGGGGGVVIGTHPDGALQIELLSSLFLHVTICHFFPYIYAFNLLTGHPFAN
jgi:hypothetical protein